MDEGVWSLKWNNHRSTFTNVLAHLREKELYVDATVACDGTFFPVHKLVLSTCSDYFCGVFEVTSCKSPVIIIKGIKSKELMYLLDYMYRGEVDVRQDELAELVKAAEYLEIKGLAIPDGEEFTNLSTKTKALEDDDFPNKKQRINAPASSSSHENTRSSSKKSFHSSAPQPLIPVDTIKLEGNNADLYAEDTYSENIKMEIFKEDYVEDDMNGVDTFEKKEDHMSMLAHSLMSQIPPASSDRREIMDTNDLTTKEPPFNGSPSFSNNSENLPPLFTASSNTSDALNTPQGNENLIDHFLTHTEERSFQCRTCPYITTRKESLKSHLVTHTQIMPLQCHICPYKCSRKSQLKRHLLTHSREKPFQCQKCSYKCSRKEQLKIHEISHSGEKPLKCTQCAYKCCQNRELKSHMLVHTGEKPFGCELCTYRCSRKEHLKKHTLTHTGEKPFQCELCPCKFSLKGHLKRHTLTHTGEKPFGCELCSYRCSRKGLLKRHKLTHTGEKPFGCVLCSYRCSQKGHLKAHLLTHTKEKAFTDT